MTYERQIATAQRLLKQKGGPAVYTSTTTGIAFSSDKPWRDTTNVVTRFDVQAAFIPYATQGHPQISEQDRTLKAAQQVYIAAADLPDVTPKSGDIIERAAESFKWRVTTVDTLNVNGEAILHTIGVEAL